MEPVTMMMVAATAIQAVGAISSANSQAAAVERQAADNASVMEQQAQASEYNAAISKQQSEQATQISTAQQLDQRRKARLILGQQRAAAAQAGVGLGGQTADLLERSETLAELDSLNLAYDGMVKARGFNTQADLDIWNAQTSRYNASRGIASARTAAGDIRSAGYMSALGSVAMGGANLYKAGAFEPKRSTVGGGYYGGIKPGSGVGFRSGGSTGLRFG